MEKELGLNVDESFEPADLAVVELADTQLALVGGGIGETAI